MTTPGYWYAAAYWTGGMAIAFLNRRRLHGWRFAGMSALLFALLTLFMTATDGVDRIYFIPCMLLVFAILVLHMFSLCEFNAYAAVYFSVQAFILGELMASLAWQIAYYLGITAGQGVTPAYGDILLILVCGLVAGTAYFLLRRYKEDNESLEISWKEMSAALLIGLGTYALSNMSYISQDSLFSSRFPAEIFIIRTCVDLGGMAALMTYHMAQREVKVKMEREYLQRLLHMQGENYRMAEESVELVNQKYHDLKHQIAILRAGANTPEGIETLNRMENEIKAYEAQNKTGNKVLDTMLTAKSLQCQRQGISLTCVADGQALDFMDPLDLSALIGNALDNAMESVLKMDDPGKRIIHLSVARQKHFVRIRVENCYTGSLRFEHGNLTTTKADRRYHGFGMKSIRRIVEKYGGSTAIDAREGWFELRILLPDHTPAEKA